MRVSEMVFAPTSLVDSADGDLSLLHESLPVRFSDEQGEFVDHQSTKSHLLMLMVLAMRETVLVHDPAASCPLGSLAVVED